MTVFSKAALEDLDGILRIYEYARAEMAENGNPSQWGNSRPSRGRIVSDISAGALYKASENGKLRGVFAFYRGEDPTYGVIDGAWSVPPPYGVMHRVAHAPGVTGFFGEALGAASRLSPALRIDTHEDNRVMLHLLEKYGFSRRGIILADDGTKRLAFDRPAGAPKEFEMNLDPDPFARIASGEKTVEMRLNDERRRAISVADRIVFINREDGARLSVTVRDLYFFEDFRALYAALPPALLGYAPHEISGASFRDMERYYSPERQRAYGVIGISVVR